MMETILDEIETKSRVTGGDRRIYNTLIACKVIGYRRELFSRFKEFYHKNNNMKPASLTEIWEDHQEGMEEALEWAVVAIALEHPGWGGLRVTNEMRKQGLIVTPTMVRSIWTRYNLDTIHKRLIARR